MPKLLNQVTSQITGFWNRINVTQRVLVAGIAVAMIAVFFVMIISLNRTAMTALYSKLSPEDASRVVKTLTATKIPYELAESENGTVILVPEDQVYELRLKIAGEGSITGQGVGFEIFDEVKVGLTDFAQQINYQRALQGELGRTISEFPSVETVRVHLVLPKRSLFIEEQQKPSASVVIKVRDGKKMDAKDVAAIVNLVSMAVEGLSKDRIAVTDAAGRTLYQPEEEGSLFGLTSSQLDYRMLTQQSLERRIEELLAPVLGPGHVIARVNANMDFNQKTIRKEMYDPNVTVVRSESRSESSVQGRASLEGGSPDVNFRGDGLNGSATSQNQSSEQRQTNYEINKEEQNIISSVGEIHRLTVSVIVDGTYAKDADGKMVYTPRTEEEVKNIKQLVSNVVGFDSSRGDTIEVSSMPFGSQELEESPSNVASAIADYAIRIGKPFLNAVLIFLFLIIVVRPVIMALIRPKVEGEMLEELAGLPMGEERLALVDHSDDDLDAMAILEKIEDIKAHAIQLSEQNMEQSLGIIRNWLKGNVEDPGSKLPAKAA